MSDAVGEPASGLGELLATRALHDLGHLAQVARVMAVRYGPELGAWAAYLPVPRDRGDGVA